MSRLQYLVLGVFLVCAVVVIVLWPPGLLFSLFGGSPAVPPAEQGPVESEPISHASPETVEALENTLDQLKDTRENLERMVAGMDAENFLRRAKGHADKYVETGDSIELDLARQATQIAFKAACAYGDVATMVEVVEWMKAFKCRAALWEQIPQSQPNEEPEESEDG